jgi:glycosyltransferase
MSRTGVDACYGDLVYVKREDTSKVVRYWRSGPFEPERFRRGWMPPHPAFFLKKSVYEKYGLYDLAFPLASDYELMLRMLYRYRVSCAYLPEVLVKMRCGGASRAGFLNTARMLRENYRAWKINGLDPSLSTFLLKPLSKLSQYSAKP